MYVELTFGSQGQTREILGITRLEDCQKDITTLHPIVHSIPDVLPQPTFVSISSPISFYVCQPRYEPPR